MPHRQASRAFFQYINGDTLQGIDDVLRRYGHAAQASVLTIVDIGTVDWADEGNGEMIAHPLPDSDLPSTLSAAIAALPAELAPSYELPSIHLC